MVSELAKNMRAKNEREGAGSRLRGCMYSAECSD